MASGVVQARDSLTEKGSLKNSAEVLKTWERVEAETGILER